MPKHEAQEGQPGRLPSGTSLVGQPAPGHEDDERASEHAEPEEEDTEK